MVRIADAASRFSVFRQKALTTDSSARLIKPGFFKCRFNHCFTISTGDARTSELDMVA
jgi:hypothetical protein